MKCIIFNIILFIFSINLDGISIDIKDNINDITPIWYFKDEVKYIEFKKLIKKGENHYFRHYIFKSGKSNLKYMLIRVNIYLK